MSTVKKLASYKGIEFSLEKPEVVQEEIDKEIDAILGNFASYEDKESDTLEKGDIAIFDFIGLKDGVAFEGGTAKNYELEIGSGQFIPGFEDQMVGMKKGEHKDFHVTFPEQYPEETLAGQPVIFKVTVHEIKVMVKPDLTDELVQKLGSDEIKTVNNLIYQISGDLMKRKQKEYEIKRDNMLFAHLIENSEVEVEDAEIDEYLRLSLEYFSRQLMSQGVSFDDYCQFSGLSKETIEANMRPSAVSQATLAAIIDEIVKIEGIAVSDEQYNLRIEEFALQTGLSKEDVLRKVKEDELKADMKKQTARQLIVSSAVEK